MNDRFLLFVYGQLRRGEIGHERLGLERRTEWLGPALVAGQLHDLGDYPGLTAGTGGTVQGELLLFGDAALWPVLDSYEDCDPHGPDISEYRRVEVALLDRAALAWIYIYNRPLVDRPLVPSGVWPRGAGRPRPAH